MNTITAQEAKSISEDHNFHCILQAIKTASQIGKRQIILEDIVPNHSESFIEFSEREVNKLKNLGFVIEEKAGTPNFSYGEKVICTYVKW